MGESGLCQGNLIRLLRIVWSGLLRIGSCRRVFRCRLRVRWLHPNLVFPGTRLVNGVQQARKHGQVIGAEEDVIAENARLRRENQELRDTNELLKAASAFFASELDPQRRK